MAAYATRHGSSRPRRAAPASRSRPTSARAAACCALAATGAALAACASAPSRPDPAPGSAVAATSSAVAGPAPATGIEPPRFAWPARTALEVVSVAHETGTDGGEQSHSGQYLLAYRRFDDGRHRFWESGPVEQDSPMARAMREVGVAPGLALEPPRDGSEVLGLAAWATRLVAAEALRGDQAGALALRTLPTRPQWRGYVREELLLEWWFVAGIWLPFVGPGAAAPAMTPTATTQVRIAFDPPADARDARVSGVIAYDTGDAVRLQLTYATTVARVFLPLHVWELIAPEHQARAAEGAVTITVAVEADRATLVPRHSHVDWEVTVPGADGVVHVGRRSVDKSYRQVDWNRITLTPIE